MNIILKKAYRFILSGIFIYYIFRIVFILTNLTLIKVTTDTFSFIVGIFLFIISLIIFFYEREKKEGIFP